MGKEYKTYLGAHVYSIIIRKQPKVDGTQMSINRPADEQDAKHKRILFVPKIKGYLRHPLAGLELEDGMLI